MNIKKSIEVGNALKGKTKHELALAINKTPSTISQYCNGSIIPSMAKVEQMADFYGAKVSVFISWGE